MNKLIAIILLSPVCAFSAPVITGAGGVLADGNQITIAGSGFDSKATAAPARWLDFNSGVDGDLLSEPDWSLGWDSINSPTIPQYSNTESYDGTLSGQLNGHNLSLGYQYQALSTGKLNHRGPIYISFKIYVADRAAWASDWKMKAWRFHAGSGASWWTTPNVQLDDYGNESSGRITYYQNNCDQAVGTAPTGCPNSFGDGRAYYSKYAGDEWLHVELCFDPGDSGTFNGYWKHYINGHSYGAFGYYCHESSYRFTCSGDAVPDNFALGAYYGTIASGRNGLVAKMYYEDVYVDTTYQRVVIGNRGTYADCTRRDVQIPTAWASSLITVDVNTGDHTDGDSVYLYVVDSSNVASAAYGPLTVSTEYDPPDPATTITRPDSLKVE